MYCPRILEKKVLHYSKYFPVLWVTGQRQTGKTAMLRELSAGSHNYANLDDPKVFDLAFSDPALFMQDYPPPVIIGEIQYAPHLLRHIKFAADSLRKPGLFWLTGSQQYHLMKNIPESLAGRAGILTLMGLSRREMESQGLDQQPFLPDPKILRSGNPPVPHLAAAGIFQIIWRGSLPFLVQNKNFSPAAYYSAYCRTYIERDVRDLSQVGDLSAFRHFMIACAARTGQLLNMADLARDAEISQATCKKWLSILEAGGLIYLLEPYFPNITKRLVKAPKLYFLDTGLAAWLIGWSSAEVLKNGIMAGAFFETWVIGELLKSWLHNGQDPPFFYYRDRDQREIDLLIYQDDTLYPLEIKMTASPKISHVRHFQVLEKLKKPIGPGGLICLTDRSLPLTEKIRTVPVNYI
ncbi:MAG: ATP-binding protein [Deltaproteobacteria bacterium]|nr:ATP-binding protein [Deltaproteobacteria bacterium]